MRKLLLGALVVAAVVVPALPSPATSKPAKDDDVRIVNLNILHGLTCERESKFCQARDRVALLVDQLEESSCPEIVGLQEVNVVIARELKRVKDKMCDGKYTEVFGGQPKGTDTERVYTTLKVKSRKVIKLTGGFRSASRVVMKSDLGTVVLVVTHQDGTPEDLLVTTCTRSCKPPCSPERSVYDCQTDAAVGLAEDVGGAKAIRVLMGDFNVTPDNGRYQRVVAGGWVDAYLAAGNPECDSATGVGCSSGREDSSIATLKDPTARETERIDFLFVKTGSSCSPVFDPVTDEDDDGLGTGLFFAEPTTDGPGGIVWVSDHTGVSADLSCAKG